VNSHFGHHARYDGDKMPIRLTYDTTLPCVSRATSHTTADRITIYSRRHDTTGQRLGMLCHPSLSRKHIATEAGDLTDIWFARYVGVCEEPKTELVELAGSTVYCVAGKVL